MIAIPALSGVLIQDHVIAWERGLGFANLESRIAARSDTPYAIGDRTEASIDNAYSARIGKVPARRATMILLANSNGLAIPFQLDAGDVTRSPFALVLLRMLL